MDFLGDKQIIIYTSKKYENIYTFFSNIYDMKYHSLFLLCAAVGAKSGKQSQVDEKSREFRSNYFSLDERNLVYTIILNDENKGKNLERFTENEFHSEARQIIENYAEGGMDILVEEVFKEKWDGNMLDKEYKDYQVDLLGYVLATLKEVPF